MKGYYEGPNLGDERIPRTFDHFCPLMGGSGQPNFWKEVCLAKQKDSINRIPQCFGGCKAEKHLKFSKNQGKITTPSKYRPRVIELTKEGFSRGKIARALHISVGTIRQYQREAKIQGLL